MDDQFNGRTDDDLFADEFEPVEPVPTKDIQVTPEPTTAPVVKDTPQPALEPVPAVAALAPPAPKSQSNAPAPRQLPVAPKSLAQSRHADPPPTAHKPHKHHQNKHKSHATQQRSTDNSASSQPSTTTSTTSPAPSQQPQPDHQQATQPKAQPHGEPPANTPSAPAAATAATAAKDKPADPNARLKSGANPRTKLTDAELAAKMDKMRILSAEKARRFEQASRDERDHAIAYEKGMEEARKRRAEDAERRKRADEDRRRMDDERARNRERKLKAIGMKEGGWDEGKEEREAEEDRRRGAGSFRGANGGVRGTTHVSGLAGSKFAGGNDDTELFHGRGRGGRGGRGGSSRGRGGRNGGAREDGAPAQNGSAAQQADLAADDFPALPPPKKPAELTPKPEAAPELPSPLSGRWDDEVEAAEAKAAEKA